jgi:hypothetical protein
VRFIKRLLPVQLKTNIRKGLLSWLLQQPEKTSLQDGKPIPPWSILKWYYDRTAFLAVGEEFRKYLIEFCNLKPTSKVLDAGCGPGRLAVALTDYLVPTGSYDGFDTYKEHIDWASQYITTKHPNFRL